ncbi:hypothetical protein BDW66DRAFT_155760 [Aspergillus desertorum]
MALTPASNPVVNGGFETGLFLHGFPLRDLQSAPGNRLNNVSQTLRGLDTTATYTFTGHVWGPPGYGGNFCSASILAGFKNVTTKIVQVDIYDQSEQWLNLTGTYQPKHSKEILTLRVGCTFSDSSVTGHILFDDIALTHPVFTGPVLD